MSLKFDNMYTMQTDTSPLCTELDRKILVRIAEKIAPFVDVHVKIFIDVEPIMYESLYSVMTKNILPCTAQMPAEAFPELTNPQYAGLHLVPNSADTTAAVVGEIYSSIYEGGNSNVLPLDVMFNHKSEIKEKINNLLSRSSPVLIIMPTAPDYTPKVSVVFNGLIHGIIKELFREALNKAVDPDEKEAVARLIPLIGKVPYELILYSTDPELAEEASKRWYPPPPIRSNYLEKPSITGLSDLILGKGVARRLRIAFSVLRAMRRGVLLLVGPAMSGRKTISYALARELGVPSYVVDIQSLQQKWVGESEKNLKTIFFEMRTRGGLLVMDGVDPLFKSNVMSDVSGNLKAILASELSRVDNFILVLTSGAEPPRTLLESPLYGRIKIIIPPPQYMERKKLATRFAKMVMNNNSELVASTVKITGIDSNKLLQHILGTAKWLAAKTAGLYPGELYSIIETYVLSFLYSLMDMKNIQKAEAETDIRALADFDRSSRKLTLEHMKQRAEVLGQRDIARDIDAVLKELESTSY